MKKLRAALLAGAAALVLLGQTTESPIPNHSVPVGRGPGVVGWGNTGATCPLDNVLTCTAADPAWKTVGAIALPAIASNNVLGNATSATATPIGLLVPSCSSTNQSLTWTTNSGFGCAAFSPGTGTVTQVNTGTGLTGGPITTTGTVSAVIATTPQILAATPNVLVDGAGYNTVQGLTTLSSATPIALDMNTFINANIALTATAQLSNPTNTQIGREGCIYFTQPSTPVTLTFAGNWKFPGAVAPTLTTNAGAVDVLCYQVRTSTFIFGAMTNDVR